MATLRKWEFFNKMFSGAVNGATYLRELAEFKLHPLLEESFARWREKRPKLSEELEKLLKRPPVGGCSHKKAMGPYVDAEHEFRPGTFPTTDFNVYLHTFQDGKRRIRCNRCGEVAWEGDSNWSAMYELLKLTTNRESSAEQPLATSKDGGKTFVSVKTGEVIPGFSIQSKPSYLVVFQDKIDLGKEQE
jgi:hypothetical protein